jgi:hypothetical protein
LGLGYLLGHAKLALAAPKLQKTVSRFDHCCLDCCDLVGGHTQEKTVSNTANYAGSEVDDVLVAQRLCSPRVPLGCSPICETAREGTRDVDSSEGQRVADRPLQAIVAHAQGHRVASLGCGGTVHDGRQAGQ